MSTRLGRGGLGEANGSFRTVWLYRLAGVKKDSAWADIAKGAEIRVKGTSGSDQKRE